MQKLHGALGNPKSTPKWSPNRAPNAPQRPPDGQKHRSKSVLDVGCNFSSNSKDLGGPKWQTKNSPKSTSAPKGRPDGLWGALWEVFWPHVGLILSPPELIFEHCPQVPSLPAPPAPSQLDHSRAFILDPFFVSPWCFLSAKPSH